MATVVESPPDIKAIQLSEIPPFPPVGVKVLNLLADPDVAMKNLTELLRLDPAFSAEILRQANSPLFGFASEIASLKHALVVLGMDRIKNIAVTVATRSYLRKILNVEGLYACWRYSLATAILAEKVAWLCGAHQDAAYTAGLLRDVGRLGLIVKYPSSYSYILKIAKDNTERGIEYDLLELERDVFKLDRYQAGEYLAAHWELPADLRAVAGPLVVATPYQRLDLPAIVHLACRLGEALGFGTPDRLPSESVEQVMADLPERLRPRIPSPEELRQELTARLDSLDETILGEKRQQVAQSRPSDAEGPPQPESGPEPAAETALGQPVATSPAYTEMPAAGGPDFAPAVVRNSGAPQIAADAAEDPSSHPGAWEPMQITVGAPQVIRPSATAGAEVPPPAPPLQRAPAGSSTGSATGGSPQDNHPEDLSALARYLRQKQAASALDKTAPAECAPPMVASSPIPAPDSPDATLHPEKHPGLPGSTPAPSTPDAATGQPAAAEFPAVPPTAATQSLSSPPSAARTGVDFDSDPHMPGQEDEMPSATIISIDAGRRRILGFGHVLLFLGACASVSALLLAACFHVF